jgi:hypothetical protein
MYSKSNKIKAHRPELNTIATPRINKGPETDTAQIAERLTGFSGGLLYRHHKDNFLITAGVDAMIHQCRADWLVLKSYMLASELLELSYFIRIELQMQGTCAMVTYTDGNDTMLRIQHYDNTDFSLESLVLYFTNNTFLLPSEY